MVDNSRVAALVNALLDKFENKVANKKTDITGDFSTDTVSYPTVQAVKSYIAGLGFLTSHQDITGKEDKTNKTSSWNSTTNNTRYPTEKLVKDSLDDKISKSNTAGLMKNDGTVDTTNYLSSLPSHGHGDITSDGKLGTTSGKPLITTTGGKISAGSFGTSAGQFAEGNHTHSQYLTSHQSLDSKTVTVEEQATAESGYAKTYVVKQNGSQVGSKINIPKDFLVKSGQVKTCSTANSPVTGYAVGDKYIDFVINAKDGSATDEHMYILVKDLVEDTTYTADGSTIQLSNGQFSVKTGGITKNHLASAVQTSLGYADNWNSSAAKGITSADISNWNSAGTSNLTTGDVDSEIDDYLDAITTALSS